MVTLEGIVIDVNPVHPLNEPMPILSNTVVSKTRPVIDVFSLNASFPIPLTFTADIASGIVTVVGFGLTGSNLVITTVPVLNVNVCHWFALQKH